MIRNCLYSGRLLSLATKTTVVRCGVGHPFIHSSVDLALLNWRRSLVKGGVIASGRESGYTGSIFRTSSAHSSDFRRERR